MTSFRLKYINAFKDRHGKLRYYFRRPGHKTVSLHGLPGSEEFRTEYEAALSGTTPIHNIRTGRFKAGTVAAVVLAYFNSMHFANLARGTQKQRRNILERFVGQYGDKHVATLAQHHIQAMVGAKLKTPSAAANFLVAVRALLQFAMDTKVIRANPATGVKPPRVRTDGHIDWTDQQIAIYEAKHPLGTKARLAFALILYTDQRIGDCIRMGWQHVRGDTIQMRREMSQEKTGTSLVLPLLPELKAALDAMPRSDLAFLTSKHGRPFTVRGLQAAFAGWIRQAGLPRGLSAHGLRKSFLRRATEAGCTSKEIAAWSGHKTLKEIERYTKSADQERLARAAAAKLNREHKSTEPGNTFYKPGKNG
jgi:integrase